MLDARRSALLRPSIVQHALTIFAVVVAAGCNVGDKPDSESGKDWEQAGAQELFLDKLVDDYLDFEEGDSTDWKFFKVRTRGLLELTIYWDNKDVGSTVNVRDRFGVLKQSRNHSSELEKDQIDMRVEAGTYFVEFKSGKGASVYTVEARFQAFDYKPSDDVAPEAVPVGGDLLGDPLMDPEPIAQPTGRRRRPRGRRPARAPAAGKTVGATITRVVPRKGGSVIYLNRGREHGLAQGQTGYIVMIGGKRLPKGLVKLRKVRARSSEAVTKARPGNIADNRTVRIRVEE